MLPIDASALYAELGGLNVGTEALGVDEPRMLASALSRFVILAIAHHKSVWAIIRRKSPDFRMAGVWFRTSSSSVSIPFQNGTILTIHPRRCTLNWMPRTRMDELYLLAEEHDGLFTSKEARALGIQDSVLTRLTQRGRLERVNRGVYRIAHYPPDRLAQYREAVLWAQASHHGPEQHIALSHETALLVYGLSDLNPARVHLTVPKTARFRRKNPEWIAIHRADLKRPEIGEHEGIPVTTVERSIADVLATTHRPDIARQAITEALREGLLTIEQASALRKTVNRSVHDLSSSTMEAHEAL